MSRRIRVEELTEKGCSPREIALLLGISTQAVYKHLKRIKAAKAEGEKRAS